MTSASEVTQRWLDSGGEVYASRPERHLESLDRCDALGTPQHPQPAQSRTRPSQAAAVGIGVDDGFLERLPGRDVIAPHALGDLEVGRAQTASITVELRSPPWGIGVHVGHQHA